MKLLLPALFPALFLIPFGAELRAQDVSQLLVAKGASYVQGGVGQPAPASQPYEFMSSVLLARPGGVISASVQSPGGTVKALALSGDNDEWRLKKDYTSLSALNAAAPDGTYTFTVNAAHDGTRTVPVALGGDFPVTPQALNANAAQSVDALVPFTVTWNAWAGGTVGDYVQFQVEDASGNPLFSTPELGEPGALNGLSATSITIPAGTLTPGTTYSGRVIFAHISQVNTTDYGQGVKAYSGYFSQTYFPLVTVFSPVVQAAGVVKGLYYVQNTTGAPTPGSRPYRFQAFADVASAGLLSTTLTLPGGGQQALTTSGGDSSPFLNANFLTQTALDGAYPAGNYVLTFQTANQGTHAITLPLPASTYPAAPQVVNFAAAQSVDPNAAFTIRWNPFAGGTGDDFVQFAVEAMDGDGIYQTPSPGQPGALNGTATGATIPAHLLGPGTSYQVRIIFAKFLGRDTSYGLGFSGYFSQTQLPLTTSGVAAVPTLTINQTGPFQWHLHANGALATNYVIENTDSLTAPVSWQPVVNFQGSATGFDFTDSVVHGANFYRVRALN